MCAFAINDDGANTLSSPHPSKIYGSATGSVSKLCSSKIFSLISRGLENGQQWWCLSVMIPYQYVEATQTNARSKLLIQTGLVICASYTYWYHPRTWSLFCARTTTLERAATWTRQMQHITCFLNLISRHFSSAVIWTSNTGPLVAPLIASDDEYARAEQILILILKAVSSAVRCLLDVQIEERASAGDQYSGKVQQCLHGAMAVTRSSQKYISRWSLYTPLCASSVLLVAALVWHYWAALFLFAVEDASHWFHSMLNTYFWWLLLPLAFMGVGSGGGYRWWQGWLVTPLPEREKLYYNEYNMSGYTASQ